MAKKKSPMKVITIAGTGLIIVILVPLLLLFGGIEVPIIGEAYADALRIKIAQEGFEIPIPTPQEEQMVKDLADENEDLIENEIPPLQGCLDISPELIVDPETEELCRQLLEDALNKFKENEMMIEEIIPNPINKTESSEDPPIEQLCDENPDNILCEIISPSPSLQLLLNVVKIDSNGTSTEATTNFDLAPLSFLVQEDTNRDFRTGFLDFDPFLKGEPNTRYTGNGLVDILIGEQSIFAEPVKITFEETSDAEGLLKIDFITPTGGIAKIINLDFDKNFNKFRNEAITQVVFKLIQLDITDQSLKEFSIADKDVFTMDVARNDFQVVIQKEEGGTERIFTNDSRLIIQGIPTKVIVTSCYTSYHTNTRVSTGTNIVTYRSDPTHPLGCIKEIEPVIRIHDTQNTNVFGLTLFDSNNQFIKTITGGTGIVMDELLQRNTNYTLRISSPEITSELSYPKAQQTKSFTCENEYDVKYRTETGEGSKTYRTRSVSWSHTFLVVDIVTVKQVNCNLVETLG